MALVADAADAACVVIERRDSAAARSAITGAIAMAVLVAAASLQGWLARVDQQILDAFIASWHRPAPADIMLVAIDDESLARIGRWPWRRAVHATLIKRLSADAAAAVGLDLLLLEPDPGDAAGDAALARAIAENGRVVLPLVADSDTLGPDALISPIPPFARAAAGLGYATLGKDADGLSRTVELRLRPDAASPRHFAAELLRVAQGSVAVDAARFLVPFAGPPGHFARVSYADLLDGSVPKGFFHHKIVLVGATAPGLRAGYATPADVAGRGMSGIELHANIIDGLRSGIRLHQAPALLSALASGALMLVLWMAMARLSPRAGALAAAGSALSALGGSWALLRLGQLWLPPAGAAMGSLLAYPLWSWRRLDAAQRFLQTELERLRREGRASTLARRQFPRSGDAIAQAIAAVREGSAERQRAWAFLEQALDHLPTGVVVSDSEGQVRLANRQAMASLAPASTRPARLDDWLHALGAARLADPAPAGTAASLEVQSSAQRTLLLALEALPSEPGGRVLGIADITALRSAQRGREEMMRFLSHDLRAPLATLISMAQLLQDPDEPPSPAFNLARIEALAYKALNLAEDFLRLSRAEALDTAAFRQIDLAVVARRAVEDLDATARTANVALQIEVVGDAAAQLMRGDADLMGRAVVNLIGNAIRHAPAESAVTVRLRRDEDAQWVEVIDRGPGIAAEILPRLFTPYTRSTSDSPEGTGLGLVIVKAVVERHGGTIEAESTPGQGACFRMRFALALPR